MKFLRYIFLYLFLSSISLLLVAQNLKVLQHNANEAYLHGTLQQAIFWSEKAIEKAKNTPKLTSYEYSIILENTAKLYIESEQYEQAEILYLEIQQIRLQTIGDSHLDYATCLDNLATVYQANGNYTKAEAMLLISKQIREKITSKLHPDYAQTLDNLALVYELLGLYDKAEDFYWQSKEIRERIGGKKTNEYATTLHNLAELYAKRKEPKKAEIFYQDCLLLTQKLEGKNSVSYAATLDGLAALYFSQKNYEKAKKIVLESMRITAKIYDQQHTDYALNQNTLADILKGEKQYEKAEMMYRENLIIFANKLGKQHNYYTNTLFNIAKLYEEQAYYEETNYEKAATLYLEVLERKKEEINKVFPTLNENEKLSFYANIKLFFNSFTNFAIKYAKKNPKIICQVFENQLIIKGLLINNSQKLRKKIITSGDTQLIQNYQLWQQKKEQLAQLYYTNTKTWRNIAIEKLTETKEALANEIGIFEKQLATQIPLENTVLQKQISWQDYQNILKNDLQDNSQNNTIIEIIRQVIETDSVPEICYLALVINSKTVDYPIVVKIKNGFELENQALKFYQHSLAEQRTDNESYQNYWQPINKILDSLAIYSNKSVKTEKVYICPDGVYHQINLNTLLNTETGSYVADEQQIYLITNAKDLLQKLSTKHEIQRETMQNGLYVLVACPMYDLPDAREEVLQINSLLKKTSYITKTYIDSSATEEAIKKLKNPILLHFATHGFFSNLAAYDEKNIENNNSNNINSDDRNQNYLSNISNPLLNSGLLLAKNIKANSLNNSKLSKLIHEDGILTAYEVSNLTLDSTKLVVLSACETGLGTIYDGEGIFGLQRAFIVAGAEDLLMSLWKVNDRATQLLMRSFYENLLQNNDSKRDNSKHWALLKAQQKVREKYPHPYFWGAFVLVGK